MDTSGVLIFAKTAEVVPAVHAQFRHRLVCKRYIAISLAAPHNPSSNAAPQQSTSGLCTGEKACGSELQQWQVHKPLGRHPSVSMASCVREECGKPARTDFLVHAMQSKCEWPDAKLGEAWTQPLVQRMCGACLVECRPHTGVLLLPGLHCMRQLAFSYSLCHQVASNALWVAWSSIYLVSVYSVCAKKPPRDVPLLPVVHSHVLQLLQAVRIRYACTWPTVAIRSLETRCTASRARGLAGMPSMPFH
jgi:hypothetical protein